MSMDKTLQILESFSMSCLTRKQQWRRVSHRARRVSLAYTEEMKKNIDENISLGIMSEIAIPRCEPKQSSHNCNKQGDIVKNDYKKIINKDVVRKRIKFDNRVSVVLIPSRDEYYQIGLGESLWWTTSDYSAFKQSAGVEFRAMLALCNMDAKTAIALMYQSDPKPSLILASISQQPSKSVQPTITESAVTSEPLIPRSDSSKSNQINAMSQLKHVNSIQVFHHTKCSEEENDLEIGTALSDLSIGLEIQEGERSMNPHNKTVMNGTCRPSAVDSTTAADELSASMPKNKHKKRPASMPNTFKDEKCEISSAAPKSCMRKSSSLTDVTEAVSTSTAPITKAASSTQLFVDFKSVMPTQDSRSPRKMPIKNRENTASSASSASISLRANAEMKNRVPLPIIIS